MKICYFFVIVAGVIALGAVTAAREIEIVKRDIAASEGKVDIETTLRLGGSKNTLIEIVMRDICCPKIKRPYCCTVFTLPLLLPLFPLPSLPDESKLLAEDPNGEAGKASLLAQLTRREADGKD